MTTAPSPMPSRLAPAAPVALAPLAEPGSPALRAAHLTVFRRGSRSFSWAARLLGPEAADRVASLYTFCRFVDDLADEAGPAGVVELEAVADALAPGASVFAAVRPELRALGAAVGEDERALAAARELVAASIADRDGRRVLDEAGLVRFAYGVAGTVGHMLCPVLGVTDPRAEPFAVDLGIALQLTNVARDVLEDAGRDRVYLPAAWTGGVAAEDLLAGDAEARAAAFRAVRRVLALADRYYASARAGFRFLPGRGRLAVAVAASVYRGIGEHILRRPARYWWRGRVVVGRLGKVRRTVAALAREWIALRAEAKDRPVHDARLHEALHDAIPDPDPIA